MAISCAEKLFICLSLFVITCYVDSYRYGLKANNLHIPAQSIEERFGVRTRIIEADISKFSQDSSYERHRRSTEKHASSSNFSTVTQLNDSHTQMIVHWAGEGSDVIIALSRDSRTGASTSSSLFISTDYGKSFVNVTDRLTIITGEKVIIDHYYNSKVLNSHYVFADITNNYIFTTTDYGRNFRTVHMQFKPKTISIHPSKSQIILGMDEDDPRKRLYVSKNFGVSWRMMQEGVKSFFWGKEKLDKPDDIYIERQQMDQGSSVLKSSDFFIRDIHQLIVDGDDFQMIGQYMFATKNPRLLGSTRTTLQLWVSYNRGPFKNAQFGYNQTRLDYYIADASEEQVFLCVTHNKSGIHVTHLYISDITGTKYSLSLENVIYYNPKGSHKNTWLKYFAHDPFADVTKLGALRGVYIANQQTNTTFSLENQRSVITFDKGGEWVPLRAPRKDLTGQLANCSQSTNCSLHLTQEFSRLYPGSRSSAIMSKKSAPGLVLGMGVTGTNLKHDPDMFVSSDAGYTWRPVLEGNQYYAMGDHGGLIISVPQFRTTNVMYYSWNEGETWTAYTFHPEKIRVYGILTEPGEMTSIFTLFGSHASHHRWLIIQIDLHSIFQYSCTEDDYKMWSFPDQMPYFGCILGKKTVYERRIAHAECYNGRDYDRQIIEKNCTCTREDFECDLGFMEDNPFHSFTPTCKEDPLFHLDLHKPPVPCPEGTYYPYSKGYRRISGDTCHGGSEYRYAPYMLSCPVGESTEFLLYSSRHFVRRYVFGSSQDESIVDINRADVGGSIYAVAFDYRENMVFWSQGSPNKIMKVSLKGASNISTVAEGRGMSTVESLVFDWTGGNLYWIDSINKSIEVARKTGEFRRVLVDSTHLDRPRGLVLDPHFGWMYWTDWSRRNPRIMKAAMDGNVTSIQMIVSGSTHVYWPNGITIDHRDMKIYWTDAHLDRISSANFDGSGIRLIVRGTYYAPHPYAIGIYKDRIFWSDWMKNAIFSADKHTGRGIITVKANISDVMDLKILDYLSQNGQTACSRSNGGCSELCLPKPGYEPTTKNRTCKCDGRMPRLTISDDGNEKCECVTGERMVNNKCVPDAGSSNCTAGRYKCGNGDCIPATWVCDHDNDCSDGSEEMNCPYASCRSGSFQCGNGRCIPGRWQCDFDNDCGDNSDENGCHYPTCALDKFTCANGRCINPNWTCDFDDDCRDGSDEVNCTYSEVCSDEEFHCLKHQPKCIAMSRRCDGIRDCTDNSDERNCTHTNTSCSVDQFSCDRDGRCIYRTWHCDGDRDCTDGSDETNCNITTTPRPTTPSSSIAPGSCHFWQFQCHSGHCVWWSNRCDHAKDCDDNSDELNCGFNTTTPAPCYWNQFKCDSGQCIPKDKKCDGSEDCYDGSDERGCYECIGEEFRCNTSTCIPQSSVCDGYDDCIHGDDEQHCEGHQECTSNQFKCYSSGECISMTSLCDGSFDCADHSDETGIDCRNGTVKPVTCPNEYKCYSDDSCYPWMFVCDGVGQCVYREDENRCGDRSLAPSVRLLSVFGRNMTISWHLVYSTPLKDASYIVSYMDKNHVTKNVTINGTILTLKYLKPLTAYDVTVYLVTNSTINRPHSRQHFITTEAEPYPPTNVKATINIGYITVQWTAPSSANGQILKYKIYCYDTKTKIVSTKMVVNMDDTKMATIVPNTLKYGDTYRVWVTAFTQTGEGKPSKNSTVTYNTERITKKPTGFSLKKGNDTCVDLSWDKMTDKDVQYYKISFTDAWNVDREISVPEDITKHRVCDLCPTEKYIFYICASNNHGKGPEDTIGYRPGDYVYHNQRYIPTWPKLKPQSIDSGKYKVVWNKPLNSSSSIKLGYTLFYHYQPADMEGNKFATKAFKKVVNTQTYTVISSIQACESYLLKVAVSKPGRCPPSLPFTMQTGEDDKAQPENLIAKFPKPTSVVISWTAGCYDPSAALAYILKITNDKTNHSHMYQTKPTNNLIISHTINGLERGANYTFHVKTNVNNGRWSEPLHLEALKYGAPEDFKEVLMKDGKIQLSWNPPPGQDKYHVHQYEIYMRRLKSAKDKGGFELYKTVDQTTRTLSINTDPSISYSFQIRIISDKGYPGFYADEPSQSIPKSEGQTGKSDINISRTRMIAIIVSVTGVVIALVLVLGFFIIRHRRLQRSFLAFANSHYDTRSGTTTFESNELGEEEDSPMIQGFSDDEPLVIA